MTGYLSTWLRNSKDASHYPVVLQLLVHNVILDLGKLSLITSPLLALEIGHEKTQVSEGSLDIPVLLIEETLE